LRGGKKLDPNEKTEEILSSDSGKRYWYLSSAMFMVRGQESRPRVAPLFASAMASFLDQGVQHGQDPTEN